VAPKLAEIKEGFLSLNARPDAVQSALSNIAAWQNDVAYQPYWALIDYLVATKNWKELLDCFYRLMPFGTGGRRGAVGVGPNRINAVTFDFSVQGHCDYLRSIYKEPRKLSVVLAWDVRAFSDHRRVYGPSAGILLGLSSLDLARSAAEVYAGNGIQAWVVGPMADEGPQLPRTTHYISTPELSFLIRRLGADGGLNVSASHNPPDDNGGKFYNGAGGQEVPPHDEQLLAFVEKVRAVQKMPYERARLDGFIQFISPQHRDAYIALNQALCPSPLRCAPIAFTPLNGVGGESLYRSLVELEFPVHPVQAEMAPDGDFPGVRYRTGNPEIPAVLGHLKAVVLDKQCAIGLATDPDADRLGLIVRTGPATTRFITGNEIGAIILQARIDEARRNGRLSAQTLFINTIVTSSLQRRIARHNGLQVVGDLMVGFKYMGNVLHALETAGRYPVEAPFPGMDSCQATVDDFLFTTEEAHGFLLSAQVRDKDACGAGVFLAGLASELQAQQRTIYDYLRDIYRDYGYFAHVQRNLVMEGIEGMERMAHIQQVLRTAPPNEIGGMRVVEFRDHRVYGGPLLSESDGSNRNVLQFWLRNEKGQEARVVVRPSGTEPKTKIYIEVPEPRSTDSIPNDTEHNLIPNPDNTRPSETQLNETIEQFNAIAEGLGEAFVRFCLGPAVHEGKWGEIPDEIFDLPDMVPLDRKLRYCREVLPALGERLRASQPVRAWLRNEQIQHLGADGVALGDLALLRYLKRAQLEEKFALAD
jgi:phosphoglucomutase/phosphomannomutase